MQSSERLPALPSWVPLTYDIDRVEHFQSGFELDLKIREMQNDTTRIGCSTPDNDEIQQWYQVRTVNSNLCKTRHSYALLRSTQHLHTTHTAPSIRAFTQGGYAVLLYETSGALRTTPQKRVCNLPAASYSTSSSDIHIHLHIHLHIQHTTALIHKLCISVHAHSVCFLDSRFAQFCLEMCLRCERDTIR